MSVKQVKLVGMGPMAPENEPKVIILRTLARVVKCGRKAENDVVLTDQSISGVHCELWLQKTEAGSITAVIKDTSTNGTFVNDRRMKKGAPQELKDKDTIQLTRPKLANANDKLALSFRIEYDASDSPDPADKKSQAPPTFDQPDQPGAPSFTCFDHEEIAQVTPSQVTASRSNNPRIQQLLLAEQNHRASVMQELLTCQQDLEAERQKSELNLRELQKVRIQLEAEKKKRVQYDEDKASLSKMVEQKTKHGQELEGQRAKAEEKAKERFNEVLAESEVLQKRNDVCEADLLKANQEKAAAEAAARSARDRADELELRNKQQAERAEKQKARAAKLESELTEKVSELESMQNQATELESAMDALKSQVASLEAENAGLMERLNKKEGELRTSAIDKREAQAGVSQMQMEMERLRSRMAEVEHGQALVQKSSANQQSLIKICAAHLSALSGKMQISVEQPDLLLQVSNEVQAMTACVDPSTLAQTIVPINTDHTPVNNSPLQSPMMQSTPDLAGDLAATPRIRKRDETDEDEEREQKRPRHEVSQPAPPTEQEPAEFTKPTDPPEPSVPLVAPSLDIMAAFEEQQEEDDDEEDNDAVFDLLD
eukprot:Platyproteum_vivax@DN6827_c0_g1_i2.p1